MSRGELEPELLARIYGFASGLSIITCVSFAVIIIYHRLMRTALMKQVVYLCLSDTLVYCWELTWCTSNVHVPVVCLDFNTCTLYYAMLRTLQMASVLWTTHIAVGCAFAVSGRSLPAFSFPAVSFLALLLCSVSWIAASTGGYVPGQSGKTYPCQCMWTVHPDTVWTVVVGLLLGIILSAYVHTLWRICRLSTAAAVTAKLYRVLSYVAVFGICYAPYVVLQGAWDTESLAQLARSNAFYQIIYLLYLLAGFFNVVAYGIHHWDAACWRRRNRGSSWHVTGNEARVVTFGPNATSILTISSLARSSEDSPHAVTLCSPSSVHLASVAAAADDPATTDNCNVQQDVMTATHAYGCC